MSAPAPAGPETTYFQEGSVTITSARVGVGAKTYALSGITSVSMAEVTPNNGCFFVIGVVGGLVFLLSGAAIATTLLSSITAGGGGGDYMGGIGGAIFGALLATIAFTVLRGTKARYVVRIGSASGESDALSSMDRAQVQRVVTAMNDAIVRRG